MSIPAIQSRVVDLARQKMGDPLEFWFDKILHRLGSPAPVLKIFIEQNLPPPKREVNLKNPQIQALFDEAVQHLLQNSIHRVLQREEDALKKMHTDHYQKTTSQTSLEKVTVHLQKQVYLSRFSQYLPSPQPNDLVDFEEDGFVAIVKEQSIESESLELLRKWHSLPLKSLTPGTLARLSEIRNVLLLKST